MGQTHLEKINQTSELTLRPTHAIVILLDRKATNKQSKGQRQMNITYGDYTVDTTKLPEQSVQALLARGLAHVLGNEASARVIGLYRQDAIELAKQAKGGDLDKEEREYAIKNVKTDTDSDEYKSRKANAQAELLAALESGKLGVGREAQPKDPFGSEVARIVKSEVLNVLRKQQLHKGAKDPSGDTVFTLGGQEFTFNVLKTRWLSKNETRFNKEAKAKVDALERLAKKAAEAGNGAGAEDLGF